MTFNNGSPKYEAFDDEEAGHSPSCLHDGRMIRSRFSRRKSILAVLLLVDLIIVFGLVIGLEPLITLLRRNGELFNPQPCLNHTVVRHGKHKIPRILHQTTANDTIPDKWVESQASCKSVYHEYEYMLWTDQGAQDFLLLNYPWFLDSFNNYAYPIQRADAIRYFVLHHYGGIYLDMDTFCNQTFPMEEFESDSSDDIAVFKSTLPTGITNDFMIASQGHPAFSLAISKLPFFYALTRFWAKFQPYANIMLSSGPLFVSLVVKDYLLQQPSLPSPAIKVIAPATLSPYIADLESSTWHRADARLFMWLGTRPWIWFIMGAIGVLAGLSIVNYLLLYITATYNHSSHFFSTSPKQDKVA